MIKYKKVQTAEELEEANKFLASKGFHPVGSGMTFVAINDEENTVEGVCNFELVPFIQPLAADSPAVAVGLYNRMEGAVMAEGLRLLRCTTKPENAAVFTKAGFKHVYKDEITMEKIY